MPMQLISSAATRPSTYSFESHEGKPVALGIPTSLILSGAQLVVEVDSSSAFRNPQVRGSAVFSPGQVTISFSAAEVDLIKDASYRIRVDRPGSSFYLVTGDINYNPAQIEEGQDILDAAGNIRLETWPTVVNALTEVFLKKDDYVAGVVDPVVLQQAVADQMTAHINSPTPHPAYDVDMQDLALIFENKLI